MPPKTFKLDAPPPHLQRFEIKGRVERVDLPLYLIWVNGIVFFGDLAALRFSTRSHKTRSTMISGFSQVRLLRAYLP